MNIEKQLESEINAALNALYQTEVNASQIGLQPTRKEFEGMYTLVCFPFLRLSKTSPEKTGEQIGEYLTKNSTLVNKYNVVKGFLNLSLNDSIWAKVLHELIAEPLRQAANDVEVMVEYASPNTNKPLHLGHLRNIFLGWTMAEILKANGNTVHRVQIINDRGIHICKSMVAWQQFGNGETPEDSGLKGDKLVGNYYVKFNDQFKKEVGDLKKKGFSDEEAEKQSPIMKKAQSLLLKWEAQDPEVRKLWEKMNGWVYNGFDITYDTMGVGFDKLYYESDTYLLGKEVVLQGVKDGAFFQKEDGSIWVDLTPEGLDEKLLLRADGTSVYMTQDIGTAILRFKDYPKISGQIYTVGNEQEYHFKVLFLILKKLGYSWASECFHLSYGMVDLPTGKMKSREGTVVDADDLMADVIEKAKEKTLLLGKLNEMDPKEEENLFRQLGLGALKYYLLRVDPKKRILFNPEESVDLQGNTGPFIQYSHARISSLLRKARDMGIDWSVKTEGTSITEIERELIFKLQEYKNKIKSAAKDYSPSIIAQYVYDLAKEYNKLWQNVIILKEEVDELREFRLALSEQVAKTIKSGLGLLGIEAPERM